jgi:phage tail sheath gpL-like
LTYESGSPTIVRCITTFIVNKFGANDISFLDVNTLATLARIIRYLKQVITSKFARVKLVDDGTIISAGSQTVSPRIIRNEMLGAYDVLISQGSAEHAAKFEENLVVERNQNDPNRLDVILPPDLVNQLRIFAVSVQFRLNFGV